MAPKKLPLSKLKKSARNYRKNPLSRIKKNSAQRRRNKLKINKKYRAELNRARGEDPETVKVLLVLIKGVFCTCQHI